MQRTPRGNDKNNINLADILQASQESPTAFGPHFVTHHSEWSTTKFPLNENIQRAPTAGWLSSKFLWRVRLEQHKWRKIKSLPQDFKTWLLIRWIHKRTPNNLRNDSDSKTEMQVKIQSAKAMLTVDLQGARALRRGRFQVTPLAELAPNSGLLPSSPAIQLWRTLRIMASTQRLQVV